MEKYRNPALPVEERVEDLLARMTLKEKMGQLNQRMFGWKAWERTSDGYGPSEAFRREVADGDGLGALYGLFRADPWSGTTFETGVPARDNARAANALQRYVIRHTRLGIPILLSEECPHGHQALDGTVMPVNLAIGATWNPPLYQEAFACVAREMRARGAHLGLVSALDILRDPRWGRSEECYGEDPVLSARLTQAVVKGLQGEKPEDAARPDRLAAVVKHFAAQGAATGGRNAGPAAIGERELREIHLPPMQAASEAGALGCMAAYNEIDGVYCHGNRRLLTGILRDEFGFRGIVMSDGGAVDVLDKITGDPAASVAQAVNAGVDMNLWCSAFLSIPEAVESGLLKQAVLDEAVRRVLRLKFQLGLFEQPFADESLGAAVLASGAGRAASLALAREVPVLLENRDGMLPFGPDIRRIAVIGPNADQLYNQLGDYTAPQRPGTGVTVLAGLRTLAPEGMEIGFAPGCGIRSISREGFAAAVELAEASDAVVLVLGGSSARDFGQTFRDNGAAIITTGVLTEMDCGEGVDVADLELGGVQVELAKAIVATGKPVVAIVIAGRPHAFPWLAGHCRALLFCAYPGPEGGTALAEILYGITNPSGRLSVSLPRSAAALPVCYNRKVQYADQWLDQPGTPLYPFGYGLGYAPFILSRLCLTGLPEETGEAARNGCETAVVPAGGRLQVEVTVRNVGERPGSEVVQLYLHDVQASVNRRELELKAFEKVTLKPGEAGRVIFVVGERELGVWNQDMHFVTEPGDMRVFVRIGTGSGCEGRARLMG